MKIRFYDYDNKLDIEKALRLCLWNTLTYSYIVKDDSDIKLHVDIYLRFSGNSEKRNFKNYSSSVFWVLIMLYIGNYLSIII